MKSLEEIKAKMESGFEHDFFGYGPDDLKYALPYEDVKKDLAGVILKSDWEDKHRLSTDEKVKAKMLEYLPFAWIKAHGERSLSADRSIHHFIAWAWLIDDELCEKLINMYNTDYAPYGKPILTYLSELLGYDGIK